MKKDLSALRESYALSVLRREDLQKDPYDQFENWFEDARNADISEPNAMTLATVDKLGQPSARIVLLKQIEKDGLIFYTNYESKKAKDIENNNQVATCFLWKEIQRQVRIEGFVEKISHKQSEAYFKSRPKASQMGAWVSEQSSIIPNREILDKRMAAFEYEYAYEKELPLPPNWGGFKIFVTAFEFWQGRPNRLHDRFRYEKQESSWVVYRLSS